MLNDYDEALADTLVEDTYVALDATGDSEERDKARAAEASRLRELLLDGEPTDEDREAALEHLHPSAKSRFERDHPR